MVATLAMGFTKYHSTGFMDLGREVEKPQALKAVEDFEENCNNLRSIVVECCDVHVQL